LLITGEEWVILARAALDFPHGFPFSQLQVEIHTSSFQPPKKYSTVRNWWSILEIAGLRPFNDEPNPKYPFTLSEYSFLNVRQGMFKIQKAIVRSQSTSSTLAEVVKIVENAKNEKKNLIQ